MIATRTVRWSVALIAVLLVVSGGYYWRFVREVAVRTATPEQNVEVRVFGIGTIEAQIVSKVGFQIVGKVTVIEADQGDFVKTGTLLAKLDEMRNVPSSERAKLHNSRADGGDKAMPLS